MRTNEDHSPTLWYAGAPSDDTFILHGCTGTLTHAMLTPSLRSSQGDGKPLHTCVLTKTADLLSGTWALPLITH